MLEALTNVVRSARFADEAREEFVQSVLGAGWRDRSPEEWVAYNSHGIVAWSFGDYRYRDPELDTWIHAVTEILVNRERVEELRRQYLTPEQIADAERQENDL